MEVKLGFLKWNFGSNLGINYLRFLCNRVIFQLYYMYGADLEMREEHTGH